jgi:RND family efflux transporter MFP subunit
MKKIIKISSVAFMLGLAACGADKADRLAELKKQQAEIQEEIAKIESELGTGNKKVKAEMKTVPVSVVTIAPDTFRHYLEVQGKVDFDQNVLVSARVPGVLTSMRVERGDRVSKGQVMATIDAQVLDQSVAELRTRLELARIAFEKQKNLWEQQIGTEMQYLTAKNNKDALERSLSGLQRQRDQYNIVAPLSGVVDNVIPNAGEAVAPGAGIIRVVNTSKGKIIAEVSEAYLAKIKKGDQAMVYFPDLNKEVQTTVDVVSQYINPTSRTFTVELRLDSKQQQDIALRPNLIAVVRIQDYKKEGALILPVNLVQKDEQSEFVYVAVKKGDSYVASKREIETGQAYKGVVEIRNGLTAQDQIITAGYQSLNDGQPVVFGQAGTNTNK